MGLPTRSASEAHRPLRRACGLTSVEPPPRKPTLYPAKHHGGLQLGARRTCRIRDWLAPVCLPKRAEPFDRVKLRRSWVTFQERRPAGILQRLYLIARGRTLAFVKGRVLYYRRGCHRMIGGYGMVALASALPIVGEGPKCIVEGKMPTVLAPTRVGWHCGFCTRLQDLPE